MKVHKPKIVFQVRKRTMKRAPLRGEAGLLRWGGTFGALPQTPLRGIPPQTPIFASRLSSDTGRFNQGSLRSLIVVFLLRIGLRWAAAQTCLGISSPNPIFASRLSSDVGRFNPGSLRSLIVVFLRFAWGLTLGCRPNLLEGTSSGKLA